MEDFLFSKELEGRATGEEIFQNVGHFYGRRKSELGKMRVCCTDGAAAMTGHRSGVVTRIQAINPKIAATHCMLHRQALASKSMAPDPAWCVGSSSSGCQLREVKTAEVTSLRKTMHRDESSSWSATVPFRGAVALTWKGFRASVWTEMWASWFFWKNINLI